MTFHEHALRPSDFSIPPVATWNRALAGETDLDQAVELLRRRYPHLCIYWGEYTGSLWALLPDQLVEAKTAFDLARRLDAILERSKTWSVGDRHVQRERPASRAADGTWAMPEKKAPSTAGQPRRIASASRRRRSSLLRRVLVSCHRILTGQSRVAPHPY
ncbi:hypothetical protein E1281_15250 [Actinomadura sp. KC345]|uniref:hypothetical protein n=1 Tax=Actinomadura sp. KC345 TaxID=2530371 RepID=UPI001047B13E|nr:hypothetical protein [Actinomadura sp. KC345]TDC54858.1 hypothetical protein E1281_15250 [Actinomadura sp. KC345]